jgi:hypothetical protein
MFRSFSVSSCYCTCSATHTRTTKTHTSHVANCTYVPCTYTLYYTLHCLQITQGGGWESTNIGRIRGAYSNDCFPLARDFFYSDKVWRRRWLRTRVTSTSGSSSGSSSDSSGSVMVYQPTSCLLSTAESRSANALLCLKVLRFCNSNHSSLTHKFRFVQLHMY